MKWILFGLRGVGKTTCGKLLAEERGCSFADTDKLVESISGKTCREIILQDGESAFRLWEEKALNDALRASVIATGGSTFTRQQLVQKAGKVGTLIYLKMAPKDLIYRKRILDPPAGIEEGMLLELLCRRDAIYDEIADFTVNVGYMQPPDVVEWIIEHCHE